LNMLHAGTDSWRSGRRRPVLNEARISRPHPPPAAAKRPIATGNRGWTWAPDSPSSFTRNSRCTAPSRHACPSESTCLCAWRAWPRPTICRAATRQRSSAARNTEGEGKPAERKAVHVTPRAEPLSPRESSHAKREYQRKLDALGLQRLVRTDARRPQQSGDRARVRHHLSIDACMDHG